MDLFEKEEIVAPTFEAAVVSAATNVAASVASKVECTRDTRGDADCEVKNCENCN